MFSVAKATLQPQMSVRLSVCLSKNMKIGQEISVWTNSKFRPNRIPEYYSYAMFDRIEYMNYSDPIIRIIRIIRNTFKRLKLGQITLKKAKKS